MKHKKIEPLSFLRRRNGKLDLSLSKHPVQSLVPAAAQTVEGKLGVALLKKNGRELNVFNVCGLSKVVYEVRDVQNVHSAQVTLLWFKSQRRNEMM